MNVSLSCPLIQMSDKRCNLIPRFPLSDQNRDERVPQSVVSVQSFEIRFLDEFLDESIWLVTLPLTERLSAGFSFFREKELTQLYDRQGGEPRGRGVKMDPTFGLIWDTHLKSASSTCVTSSSGV